MELQQSYTQTPVHTYSSTELLSFRTKTSMLSFSTVVSLKDLNIGFRLPRRHRSIRCVNRKNQDVQPFIVASFNAQSMNDCDRAYEHCEISTYIKDKGVDLLFVTET